MLPGSQTHSTTQDYLDVFDITNNLIILKSGIVSLVLSVGAMNFGLLAEAEQDAVIYTYAALLNSLNYPIQILVQSQAKDVTDYLNLLKQQEEAAGSDHKRERIQRYRQFVSEIIRERNVLDKKFYTIIPASPSEIGLLTADSVIPGKSEFDISKFEKSYILEKAEAVLEPRRDHLISQFARIGLYSRQLETQEIIRIFYTNYNPEASEGQELTDTSQYTTPLVRASLVNFEPPNLNQGFQVPQSATSQPPTNQPSESATNQPPISNEEVETPTTTTGPIETIATGPLEPTTTGFEETTVATPNTNRQLQSAAADNFTHNQTKEKSLDQLPATDTKTESLSFVDTQILNQNDVPSPSADTADNLANINSAQEQNPSFNLGAPISPAPQTDKFEPPQPVLAPQNATSFQENLDEFEVPANLSRHSSPNQTGPISRNNNESALSANEPNPSSTIASLSSTQSDTTPIINKPTNNQDSLITADSSAVSLPDIASLNSSPGNETTHTIETPPSPDFQKPTAPEPASPSQAPEKPVIPVVTSENTNQAEQIKQGLKPSHAPELDESLQTSINQVLQQVSPPDQTPTSTTTNENALSPSVIAENSTTPQKPTATQNALSPNTSDNLPPIAEIE